MAGLLALGALGLYVLGGYILVRRARQVWIKIVLIVLLVLIPSADTVYGRLLLEKMCAEEGGARIYRPVNGVEGFYSRGLGDRWVRELGYKFVESREGEKLVRLSISGNGQIERQTVTTLQSRYTLERREERTGGYLKVTYEVVHASTRETLGRFVDINFYGGWVNRLISIDGPTRVAHCADEGDASYVTMVTSVLRPAK
jgi:hypothetical protein